MPNSKYYRSKEWQAFRKQCLKLSGGNRCEGCGKIKTILTVHHLYYTPGRKIWDYPVEHMAILCKGCHAEVHEIKPPSSGWEITHSDYDEGEPSDRVYCDYCRTELRWHNYIFHPEWGEMLVGYECAEKLSLGPELKMKISYHRRRKTFINSNRWIPTPKGCRINRNGYGVLIFRQDGAYKIKIDNEWGKLRYETENEAKSKAFEVIEHKIKKQRS